jgi:quinolinate synthase
LNQYIYYLSNCGVVADRVEISKGRNNMSSQSEKVETAEKLKSEKNAAILAHNYQPPEIQDIADYLGDSLELSRMVQDLPEQFIIFCGVHFMAETAAILSPAKKIILPEPSAGCPLADTITREGIKKLQSQHPGATTVMYVNSPAEVKAETDICCTSANAAAVVKSIPSEESIIFGPDKNLGSWVEKTVGRDLILWDGRCPPHQEILPQRITELRRKYPESVTMVHPEVIPEAADVADQVLGTGGMIKFASRSRAQTFLVGTEPGMCYRLKSLFPHKDFIPVSEGAICEDMKKITLEKVVSSLKSLQPVITVASDIAERARSAIERMVAIT